MTSHKSRTAFALFVVVAAVIVALGGCASTPEVKRLVRANRNSLTALRAASQPKPGVDATLWNATWDEAERGGALMEREVE